MTHTITATSSTLVTLNSATDQPTTITAAARLNDGLLASYTDLTIVNAGLIAAKGVTFTAGGSLTNQSGGTISGSYAIYAKTDAVTVVNVGSITGSSDGVNLRAGGSVTNQSGGKISGGLGILSAGSAVTVVNAGSITGSNGNGIGLNGGGSVTNQSGGAISGNSGIYTEIDAATVVNAGSIAGSNTGGRGVALDAGGSVTNQSGGAISGYYGVYGVIDAVTVVNAGSITGSDDGVILRADGSVTNQSGGSISGVYGIYAATDAVTVVNAGSITGSDKGVNILAGGSATNQSGGTISSKYGIWADSSAVTVVNAGSIIGSGTGIRLNAGGSVTNQSGGAISGVFAIYAGTDAAAVVNAGSIAGNIGDGAGIVLSAGGSVTNQIGGTISGYNGIFAWNGAVTVVNAGTITGSRDAVYFAAGSANRVVIDPNAVFFGTVTGGNTIGAAQVSTLELASAGSVGTLSGLGTQFVDFAQVTVDAGAQWTLAGANTLAADATLTNAGTLIDAGSLTNAGTLSGPLTLAAGGVLSNNSTGTVTAPDGVAVDGAAGGAVTVVNAGVIAGGTGGFTESGVYLHAGGSVTNQSGGTISGKLGIYSTDAATVTVVNAGSIAGSGTGSTTTGLMLRGGGAVTNQSGGTISGYTAIVGSSLFSVANAGLIAGSTDPNGVALWLSDGGSVTNQSDGTISGGAGIVAYAPATVVNAGTITGNSVSAGGDSGRGVDLGSGGTVTNQSGGAISGNYGIFAGTAATAVVNAGSITGATGGSSSAGIRLTAGSVTNQSGGVISGQYGISTVDAGVTVVNAGTIAGSTYAVKFATGSTSRLIVDSGAVFTGDINGGGGVLALGSDASAGTLSGFGTTITDFSTLQFDAGSAWTISGNDSANGLGTTAITGFADNDTIDLTGFLAVSGTFTNNELVLTDGNGDQATLATTGSFTSGDFQLSNDGNGGTDIVLCFVAGTHIATPTGEVPVQQLQQGDLVLTAQNGPRPVKWIGHGKVLATRNKRSAATPVIVRKGALADNVPNRDLHVTKAHALYIDDVLIPVEFLVNHKTILWDDRAQEVEIYHVELDSHDVLIANGAPAESYRDDGNRWLFQNANTGWLLPPLPPCAPVLTGGTVVDAAWRRLLDRAGPRDLPPLTEDPDLHLIIDGIRLDPQQRDGARYRFHLPSRPASLLIASREVVPAEFGIARDPRSLGVALRQVVVRQGAKSLVLHADDPQLTVGFHPYEADCNLRWTDGRAELAAEVFAQFSTGAEVTVHLGGATQYPDDRASPARAAA